MHILRAIRLFMCNGNRPLRSESLPKYCRYSRGSFVQCAHAAMNGSHLTTLDYYDASWHHDQSAVSASIICSMKFAGMAVLAFASTMCFRSGADSALCPPVTTAVTITSKGDVQNLTDALACEGKGDFKITWYSSVTIEKRIEVFDRKNVTVTGASSSRFDGGLGGDNADGVVIDAGSGTGIFSVSNGSTLRLNNLVLEGGNAENGGAVDVRSFSSFIAFGCIFSNNNASNGGERPRLR